MSQTLRKIGLALGFTTIGALSAMTVQAVAQTPVDAPGAQMEEQKQRGQKGAPFMRLMDKLDLTEAQQAELAAIKAEHHEERRSVKRSSSRGAMLQMIASDPIDRVAVHDAMEEQMQAQIELMHAHTDDYLDFIEALDADQKMQLAELAAQAGQRKGSPEGRPGRRGR